MTPADWKIWRDTILWFACIFSALFLMSAMNWWRPLQPQGSGPIARLYELGAASTFFLLVLLLRKMCR